MTHLDTARAAPAARPLDVSIPIVILASACWHTPTPVNVHHLARRLVRLGHDVLFVESTGLRTPSGRSGHDVRRVIDRLRNAGRGAQHPDPDLPNLAVLSPLAIPGSRGLLQRISDRAVARSIRRTMRRLSMQQPIVWAFLPTHHSIANNLPHRALVYQCVDHYAANPGVDRARIDAAEAAMLRSADVVIATSRPLADRLSAQRDDVILSPNVADVEMFAPAVREKQPEPSALADLSRPRLVYAGNLAAYRLDVTLLTRVMDRMPHASLTLIGPVGLGDTDQPTDAMRALLDRPNVRRLDPVPQRNLAAYYRHCDIALLPFLDNEHTRGSLPMKLWEYLAAGLPVIATDLPHLRDLAPQWAIRTARDTAGWMTAIEAAQADPTNRRDRLELARQHDSPTRIEQLRSAIAAHLAVPD